MRAGFFQKVGGSGEVGGSTFAAADKSTTQSVGAM